VSKKALRVWAMVSRCKRDFRLAVYGITNGEELSTRVARAVLFCVSMVHVQREYQLCTANAGHNTGRGLVDHVDCCVRLSQIFFF
jgi:hypothetical protein